MVLRIELRNRPFRRVDDAELDGAVGRLAQVGSVPG